MRYETRLRFCNLGRRCSRSPLAAAALLAVTATVARAQTDPITTGATTLQTSITNSFTAIVPAAIAVFGLFFGWRILRKLFKSALG